MSFAILSCAGLDKPEGALAREVAILNAELTGGEIICPVLLNRAPARYRKALENRLVVVDGCATRCATRLAEEKGLKVDRRVMIADEVKASAQPIEPSLRSGPNSLALARKIVERLKKDMDAPPAEAPAAMTWQPPTEFLKVTHDKFVFQIPAREYLFNENDCWVRVMHGIARVGISDYMQQKLTDLGFFEPTEIGAKVEQFGELGSVESAKAVFEIISPVSGTVIAANPATIENPGLANADPYGDGWLVEIKLENLAEDQELLLDGTAYAKTVKTKAAE